MLPSGDVHTPWPSGRRFLGRCYYWALWFQRIYVWLILLPAFLHVVIRRRAFRETLTVENLSLSSDHGSRLPSRSTTTRRLSALLSPGR